MKKNLLSLVTLFLCFQSLVMAQSPGTVKSTIFDPDSILVGNRQLPSVFLVGSFHFGYYNLDAYKTKEEDQVDVLSPKRQAEMQELMEYIYRFKPNKIAVESGPITGYLMHRYKSYRNGEKPLARDEMEQIGFRIMEHFNLDTIYGVNDVPVMYDLYDGKDSLTFRPVLDEMYADWDFSSDDEISLKYKEFYNYDDQLALKTNLLDYFKYMNSDKVLDRGFGAYLAGDFKLGDTRGADALAMHWYSRNLRIFRHIQQITTSPEDRILVLFGAGHIEILKHLFECTPEYRFVKFGDL